MSSAAPTQHDMECLIADQAVQGARRRVRGHGRAAAAAAAVASAVGAAAFIGAAVAVLPRGRESAVSPASTLTVRSLLESDEFKDVTTNNILVLQHDELADSSRDQVRQAVSRSLLHIDGLLAEKYPKEHAELKELEVSGAQKDGAMRVLRKYGDERMAKLSHAISEAVQANARESGDEASLHRRLSATLQPRLMDLVQLSVEMFPDTPVAIDTPALRKWHPEFEIHVAPRSTSGRRLSALDGVDTSVAAHAQSLFESMEHELGDKMPRAPSRMLLSMYDGGSSPGATAQGGPDQKQEKFMSCVMKAVPHPTKIAKCLADNIEHVVKMAAGYVRNKVF